MDNENKREETTKRDNTEIEDSVETNQDQEVSIQSLKLEEDSINEKDEHAQDQETKEEIEEDNDGTSQVTPVYYVSKPEDYNRPPRKQRGLLSYFIVALIAALLGGAVSAVLTPMVLYDNILSGEKEKTIEESPINITTKDDITAVTAVAKKATKTVVGITTVEVQQDFIWGSREVQGIGSGVIIHRDGYILTNSHVIGDGGARRITVQLEAGEQKTGKVLWYDTSWDLAIVKIDATNLPVADLGDSDALQIGEVVVAIGNPFSLDLEKTVTSGIVSGLNRTIRMDQYTTIDNLVQTDATINPGNSGGPLLNAKGEVIGINTAKIRPTEGFEGLGFALPINIAKPIIEQVIEKGTYKTAYMGISGIEVELYEARLGVEMEADEGVIVIEIVPNSPAQQAGLMAGDIIQKLDGETVDSMNDLTKRLFKYKPGEKGHLAVIRNGEKLDIEIIFGERPENQ